MPRSLSIFAGFAYLMVLAFLALPFLVQVPPAARHHDHLILGNPVSYRG